MQTGAKNANGVAQDVARNRFYGIEFHVKHGELEQPKERLTGTSRPVPDMKSAFLPGHEPLRIGTNNGRAEPVPVTTAVPHRIENSEALLSMAVEVTPKSVRRCFALRFVGDGRRGVWFLDRHGRLGAGRLPGGLPGPRDP